MRRQYNIYALGILLLAISCQEETIVPDNSRLGTDFFPMEKGLFWEYEVNLTTYNLLDSLPLHYFLREVVADTFTDLSGQTSFRLERFSRDTASVAWELDSVWTARVSATQVVRTENNVPFIKLTFPLAEGKQWNGNTLNNRGTEPYTINSLGGSLELGDTTFNNTLVVLQKEVLDTIVFQDVRREYFASEVGMVKKEFIQLNYCSSEECFGQKIIDSGRKLRMELVAYGKE